MAIDKLGGVAIEVQKMKRGSDHGVRAGVFVGEGILESHQIFKADMFLQRLIWARTH